MPMVNYKMGKQNNGINAYRTIVGGEAIDELRIIASKLKDKSIQNINSTSLGGGVAEILSRIIPLMHDLDINIWWNVIKADERFFEITKKIHNGLHGVDVSIGRDDFNYFVHVSRINADNVKRWADIVFIHDPQPIGLVRQKRRLKNKWVWRCHVDFSRPKPLVWSFLKKFIEKFDATIFLPRLFPTPSKFLKY